jgi:hypothetical protein
VRVAFIGAGGVGGYFGGKLAQAGVDTTFIVRGATLAALRADGLRVDSIGGDFVVNPVQATDDPSTVGPVDAVFVTVKAWQIAEAVANIGPLLGRKRWSSRSRTASKRRTSSRSSSAQITRWPGSAGSSASSSHPDTSATPTRTRS